MLPHGLDYDTYIDCTVLYQLPGCSIRVVDCSVKWFFVCLLLFCEQDGSVQITWDKPSELEEYIGKLQAAAERLTTENRRLRHCHTILVEKVHIT